MIRLNFRESPPTRSQHIRGDARSHAGVPPVLVPGGLIEGTTPCEGEVEVRPGPSSTSPRRASASEFFTLGGAVPSLLNTGISAGAEFFSFGSRRGIWDRHSYFAPFNFQSSKIPIVPSGGGFCTVSAFPTINRLALPGHAAFC